MTQNVSGWLPNLLGPVVVESAGVPQTPRGALNFIGCTVADNPANNSIDITPGSGSYGAGVATFLTTPSSANLLGALLDETGTGKVVFHNSPTLTTPRINNTTGSFQYIFGVGAITASRSVIFPVLTADDTFVFLAQAQTLTNKTLSGSTNTFSSIPFSAMAAGSQNLPAVTSFVTTVDTKCTGSSREPVNVQTTDATVTTLDSFTIPTNCQMTVTWIVSAIQSTGSNGGGWSASATFRNNAGTVSQVGTTIVTVIGTNQSWAPSIDNSTTTIRLRVTGAVATTVRWGSSGSVVAVIP